MVHFSVTEGGGETSCPHCGVGLNIDEWDTATGQPCGGSHGVTCPTCDQRFVLAVAITATYSASKCPAPEEKPPYAGPVIERSALSKKFAHLDIVFSVYDTVEDGDDDGKGWLVTDETGDIPVPGKAVFFVNHNPFWGQGESYESPVMEDATYAQIAELADAAMKVTGDRHHQFFEGVQVTGETDGVKRVKLQFGS